MAESVDVPIETAPSMFDAVAALPIAEFVRQSDWAYPILEIVHVLGLALVFTPILLFDLRILGMHADIDIDRLRRLLLPWVWAGFALNAASGLLMFVSDAVELSANLGFRIKILLIAIAGLNALLFQKGLLPAIGPAEPVSRFAKVSAATSIALWLAVISAGRLMAYLK